MGTLELPETLLELFERAGAPNELFEHWDFLETRAARRKTTNDPLPRHVRVSAVHNIEVMAKNAECSMHIFRCAALFDRFCNFLSAAVGVDVVPSVCAAVVAIAQKEDRAEAKVKYPALAKQASVFARLLSISGHQSVKMEVTEAEIQAQEFNVFQVLGGAIHIPSIDSWMMATLKRLLALTGHQHMKALQGMWQTHLVHMMRLVLLKPAGPEMTCGSAVCGLFSLGLLAVRLLPLSALKSDNLDADSWRDVLSAGFLPAGFAQPPVIPPEESESLLIQLTIATGRDLTRIRADCELLGRIMRDEIQLQRSMQTSTSVSMS